MLQPCLMSNSLDLSQLTASFLMLPVQDRDWPREQGRNESKYGGRGGDRSDPRYDGRHGSRYAAKNDSRHQEHKEPERPREKDRHRRWVVLQQQWSCCVPAGQNVTALCAPWLHVPIDVTRFVYAWNCFACAWRLQLCMPPRSHCSPNSSASGTAANCSKTARLSSAWSTPSDRGVVLSA